MINISQKRTKILARILLPFLTIFFCYMPSKTYAIAPAIFFGASAVLHTVIAAITFDTSLNSTGVAGATDGGLRVQLNPLSPLPVPVGWTPSLVGSVQPTPPPTLPAQPAFNYSIQVNSCPIYKPSADAACAAAAACYFTTNGRYTNVTENNCFIYHKDNFAGGATLGISKTADTPSCPEGYSAGTATSCTLINPVLVKKPSDAQCNILRDTVSNTFKPDTSDPDCQGVLSFDANGKQINIDAANIFVKDKSITVMRSDGTKTSYQLLTTGGAQIQTLNYDAATNTTTYSTIQTSVPAADGTVKIDGLSSSRVPGGGTLAGSSPAGSGGSNGGLMAGGASGSGSAVGTATGTGTGWPDDYVRSGEPKDAAGLVVDKLESLSTLLTVNGINTGTDPVAVKAEEMPFFGTTFSGLTSWQLPAHSSQCPTPSMNLGTKFGGVYVMNSHCSIMADHGQKLRLAMIAAWAILSLFVVLRA